MKIFLKRIVEAILPLDLDENLLNDVNNETYRLLINLPFFLKFPCFVFIIICNLLSFKNFVIPFYFCNLKERKNLVKKNLTFRLLNGNLLKILITYSSLAFFDNPKVQDIIGYKV
tara:strand:- start:185 stop:529 length:345 start_codon:yes stop_codon:yes gene_type:complete